MRDLSSLAAYIAAGEAVPFAWGTNDCVMFAAGAVLALTGINPLAGIGRWKTERGALRALVRCGGLAAAVSSVLTEIPIAHAHRGDIGAINGERGLLLVVIEGMTLVGPDLRGLSRLPRDQLVQAWSSGS